MGESSIIKLSRRKFLALSGGALAAATEMPSFAQTVAAQQTSASALTSLTLKQAADLIRSKKVTSVELTQACLARIEKYEPILNAFITVSREKALTQARAMDDETAKGKSRGPLHGIPIALKDNIDIAGVRTTAASAILIDNVSTEDAEVVRRLKGAGAVLLGKLNMDEFASGGSTTSSYFGPAKNPWNIEYSPSGSSGGAGVAVAAELCFGALGTDTRGSIRGPASVGNIVGLKTTYGRVSNRGVIPFIWSLDTVGPMCRTVEDTAILMQAIAGYDPADASSENVPVPDYAKVMSSTITNLRLGIPAAIYMEEDIFPAENLALIKAALPVFENLTSGFREVHLPRFLEPSHNFFNAEALAFHSQWYPRYERLYMAPLRRLLKAASGISAADYARTRNEMVRVRREIVKLFDSVDLIVCPASNARQAKIEDILKSETAAASAPAAGEPFRAAGISLTSQFSFFGLPAMSIPCGFRNDGLPLGIQIVGPPWGEGRILALAHAFERATDWHKRRPKLPEPGEKKMD